MCLLGFCLSVLGLDSDGDGLSDAQEAQFGLNPLVADTALMNYFSNLQSIAEVTGRAEGNTSGIAYALANPQLVSLYTEADLNVSNLLAQTEGDLEGNQSATSHVTNNPALYSLYSDAEISTLEKTEYEKGYQIGLSEGRKIAELDTRTKLASGSLKSVLSFSQQARPHSSDWYYQPEWGWMFTNENSFPYVLRIQDNGNSKWLYFSDDPELEEAMFYDLDEDTWLSPKSSN